MTKKFNIDQYEIGNFLKPFVIAELSANHNGKIENVFLLIDEAKKSGAHAIKLQTYHPDLITLNSSNEDFIIKEGPWKGSNLYDLYSKGYTPWEWHKNIFDYCHSVGMTIFSSPFDNSAVDLLEDLNAPAYKIASFELVDIPLIKYAASTRKPLIMSVGMANKEEIYEAISAAKDSGCDNLALLHCVSNYPAKPEEFNLREIKNLADEFKVIVGLSDHTIGNVVAISSVILGAAIIEKHLTLNRMNNGLDDSFSSEPEEFKLLCQDVEDAWKSLGQKSFERCNGEKENIKYRKSLYFIADLNAGDIITEKSIRCVRPGYGIKPKFFNEIIGKRVKDSVKKFTPVLFELIED